MRLTCPNCGAQYEVPDDVIPEEGRDVQCSNCGDTWFQQAAGFMPPPEPQPEPQPQPETQPDPVTAPDSTSDTPASDAEPSQTVRPEAAPASFTEASVNDEFTQAQDAVDETQTIAEPQATEPSAQDDDGGQEAKPESDVQEAEPNTTQQSRGLDPALGDILREEAERETNLRAADSNHAQSLETQPNLGLDDLPDNDAARRSRQAKDRMARIRGEDPRRLAAEASGQKRGVLPDIEEINSTLRAADSQTPPPVAEQTPPPPRKSGFTRGFALVILIVLALVMVYSNAPQIAEIMPQSDPYLSSFVTWVDQMRLWLDTQVTAMLNSRPL